MSVVKLISKSASKVIEAGGLHWKIKRVRSRDVLRAGLATMIQFAPEDLADVMKDGADASEMERQLTSNWAHKMAAMTDVQQAKMSDSLDALVCAGVIEASEDGDTWEAIRFTMNEREADPEASVLMVDTLPWSVRQSLSMAVQSHSREGLEAEIESVATFREGTESRASG